MTGFLQILPVLMIVIDFYMLGASRIKTCIRLVACQGFIVAVTPIFMSGHYEHEMLAAMVVTLGVKCILLPFLLFKTLNIAKIRKEVEPFVGFSVSVLFGIIIFIISFMISYKLSPHKHFIVTVSILTIFIGLFIIVSRKKAISQVIGYLIFENGIYFLGVSLAIHNSIVVELGVLLDVFVLIFITGIAVFHISREFNHIDTDRLTHLSDRKSKKHFGKKKGVM